MNLNCGSDSGLENMSHILGSLKGIPGDNKIGRTLQGCGQRGASDYQIGGGVCVEIYC